MLGFHVPQTEFIQRECNDRRLKDGLRHFCFISALSPPLLTGRENLWRIICTFEKDSERARNSGERHTNVTIMTSRCLGTSVDVTRIKEPWGTSPLILKESR